MLETGVVEASGGADPAPPRGGRPGRPPRHGHGPGPAVRAHARARRPARGALRHRHQGGPRARGGVGPARAGPPAARHHRVPRPPPGPGRHRARGRRHARRRHRVHGAPAPAQLRPGLAALPARPHGRQDRRRAGPGAPRERHHRPLQPWPAASASGCARYGRSVQRARLDARRPEATATAPVDTEGRTGVDRHGPARRARSDQRRSWRPTRRWPSAPGPRRRSPRSCRASGSGWPGRVKSVRVQPRAGTQNLECVLSDGTGGLLLVFQGRPKIAGIEPGARLVAEGMVGSWGRRPAMLNPLLRAGAGRAGRPDRGVSVAPAQARCRAAEIARPRASR